MRPTERYEYILEQLNAQGQVNVDQLATTLEVSRMTIHRDLNRLVKAGKAQKVHGGAVLAESLPQHHDRCPTCHIEGAQRGPVILHFSDQRHERACCPHCGLLSMIQQGEQIQSALMTDFLYGRMTNARTSSYVIDSAVRFCCTPSVLAFESFQDAKRFQHGFGGTVYDLEEALRVLKTQMSLTMIKE